MYLLRFYPWLFVALLTLGGLGCSGTPAVREPSSVSSTLLVRGKRCLSSGQRARAEQYFLAAREAGASRFVVFDLLLRASVEGGHLRSALTHVRDELRVSPLDPHLRQLAASLALALDLHSEAQEHVSFLLLTRNLSDESHLFLGQYFDDESESFVQARRHYQAYLAGGGARSPWVKARLQRISLLESGARK